MRASKRPNSEGFWSDLVQAALFTASILVNGRHSIDERNDAPTEGLGQMTRRGHRFLFY